MMYPLVEWCPVDLVEPCIALAPFLADLENMIVSLGIEREESDG